ncbi:hypothetical protein MHY1_01415 [Methylovirgula sp. HY1]|nr:hypothetical protein MHY1_01415 [Methylovirgula sp. HY1]
MGVCYFLYFFEITCHTRSTPPASIDFAPPNDFFGATAKENHSSYADRFKYGRLNSAQAAFGFDYDVAVKNNDLR